MPQVRPLRNLVLVERVRREKTAGGIVLPATFDHKNRPSLRLGAVSDYWEAKVLAVGPRVHELSAGDTVLVHTYVGGQGSQLFTGHETGTDGQLLIEYPDDVLAQVELVGFTSGEPA
jgi:co-chaperonin GroES (HSP10)